MIEIELEDIVGMSAFHWLGLVSPRHLRILSCDVQRGARHDSKHRGLYLPIVLRPFVLVT